MKEELKKIFEKDNLNKKPLFIFDMANNHNGDVNHGLNIIKEVNESIKDFKEDFIFGFKFQYRDIDTFIHPDFRNRKDIKYIKRFSETRLKEEDFIVMKEEIDRLGFITLCTPFDEKSVDLIEKHNFDIIKIASCSLTDWPLLERIAKTEKPIIASTAGNTLEDIDKVVIFLTNRNKKFVLMHCVAEYPTENKNLQLNQIDLLKQRYQDVNIGFSTHENPDNLDAIKIAIAKGVMIFEKHVALGENRNLYSANPEQIKKWLKSAKEGFEICGIINKRVPVTEKEKQDLRALRRAVFAKTKIKKGEKLNSENIFYAIPSIENQILANDLSKYSHHYLKKDIYERQAILFDDVEIIDTREKIKKIVYGDIKDIINKANIPLNNIVDLEISHHYGIDRFYEFGCVIINVINRDYCKKFIIILPGQINPTHYHKIKEESFIVDYGDIIVEIDGVKKEFKRGDIILVKQGQKHSFTSKNGGIFEEISTTHHKEDSYYEDESINNNKERKTFIRLNLNN
ncbi:MAG: N-acetylneuraminate synthase family protein [Candidatus Pacearchaeota archaeon]